MSQGMPSVSKGAVRDCIFSHHPNEWELIDPPETHVLREEGVTIEQIKDWREEEFVWANSFPNSERNKKSMFRVSRYGVPTEQFEVCSIDGGRILVREPLYDHDEVDSEEENVSEEEIPKYITAYDARLGEIMSMYDFRDHFTAHTDVGIRDQDYR